MKLTVFALLSSILFTTSFAQKETRFTLRLEEYQSAKKIQLPFSAIKVIDARFEQNNIGCVVKDLSFKGMTNNKMLAVFPEHLNTYLPKVLATIATLEKESADTLLILVKQFRIADHLANTLAKYHEPQSVLTLSCSFYKADKGQVIKISSFDEVLAEKWIMDEKTSKQEIHSLRAAALMNLLSGVFENKKWSPSQAAFSLADVEQGIEKRFQLPLLHDTVLVAGIYKNFREFQHNSPSVFDLQIGWQHDEIKEVRDANSNLLNPRSFWGLCDGKHRYISFLGRLYKLDPIDNSFRILFQRVEANQIVPTIENFYGNGPGIAPRDILPAVDVINLFKKNVRREYLYLNMETGKVHVEELIGNADARNY